MLTDDAPEVRTENVWKIKPLPYAASTSSLFGILTALSNVFFTFATNGWCCCFFVFKMKIFVTPATCGLQYNIRRSVADLECWCLSSNQLRTISSCEKAGKLHEPPDETKPLSNEKVEHGDGVVIIMLTFQFCPLNRLSKTTEQIQATRSACSRAFWLIRISPAHDNIRGRL